MVPGVIPPNGQRYFFANWSLIESDYFRTLAIPIVAGRDFGAGDHEAAQRVAIVGESAAQRLWPGKNPVGQTLFVATPEVNAQPVLAPLLVVGVARDVRVGGSRGAVPLSLYVPLQQQYVPGIAILARRAEDRRLAPDLRALVTAMSANLPVLRADTLENQQNNPKETTLRVAAAIAASVGVVGLLLAAVGIYGVTAYTVTQRTREIGIRLALGATHAEVVGMVLRQGMRLVAVGSTIGLLCGAATAMALSNAIDVSPPDSVVFGGTALLFAAVGFVACYLPVRGATRVNAMAALRYE
jgi:putative ABC transport system permease protein